MKNGLQLIAEERQRQIIEKGFTALYDHQCRMVESIRGGFANLKKGAEAYEKNDASLWPYNKISWKPDNYKPIVRLIKSGAMYQAQYDCLIYSDCMSETVIELQRQCSTSVYRVAALIDEILSAEVK